MYVSKGDDVVRKTGENGWERLVFLGIEKRSQKGRKEGRENFKTVQRGKIITLK